MVQYLTTWHGGVFGGGGVIGKQALQENGVWGLETVCGSIWVDHHSTDAQQNHQSLTKGRCCSATSMGQLGVCSGGPMPATATLTSRFHGPQYATNRAAVYLTISTMQAIKPSEH